MIEYLYIKNCSRLDIVNKLNEIALAMNKIESVYSNRELPSTVVWKIKGSKISLVCVACGKKINSKRTKKKGQNELA